jgi:hypothetical protein
MSMSERGAQAVELDRVQIVQIGRAVIHFLSRFSPRGAH